MDGGEPSMTPWCVTVALGALVLSSAPVDVDARDVDDAPAVSEPAADHPWLHGAEVGVASAAVLLGMSVLLGASPACVVSPILAPFVGAVAGVAALGVAGLRQRRVPVLGLLVAGGLAQTAGCVAGAALVGVALCMVLLAATDVTGFGMRYPMLLGAVPLLGLSVVAQVAAAILGGAWMAALAGPCSRPRAPWEELWNTDLLGTPPVEVPRPRWVQQLETAKSDPEWEAPAPPDGDTTAPATR